MIREEIETSRFQTFCDEKEKSTIPISVFFFCSKNAKSNLRHKRSFDAQIQNKDCVFDNTITKVQWSLIGQCNNYPFYCSQYQIQWKKSISSPPPLVLTLQPSQSTISFLHVLHMPFPLGNHSKYSQRWLLVVVVSMKYFCKLKSEYCSTTQNCLFKILSLSAEHWWSKSTQRAKHDFSRELEKTLSEESRRERESVCKISFLREEKENFFPNLEFREENENFFVKILTFENISRNENSILQLEIEKNGPFPLEIFSRSRISSMPGQGCQWSEVFQKIFLSL